QFPEALHVIRGILEAHRRVNRQAPIPSGARADRRPLEQVRRRQAAYVGETGGVGLQLVTEEEKVGYRLVVQLAGDVRMPTEAPERVAEQQAARWQGGVEERLPAQLVSRAEQPARSTVPDRERKITEQARRTLVAPRQIRA